MTLAQRRRALMMAADDEPIGPGWMTGVPYTNIVLIPNQYYTISGGIVNYEGWSRTEYIPCHGASRIVCPIVTGLSTISDYGAFFDENYKPISGPGVRFRISGSYATTNTVPSNAWYFGFSQSTAIMQNYANSGITPYE